jgi:hypothetical protein
MFIAFSNSSWQKTCKYKFLSFVQLFQLETKGSDLPGRHFQIWLLGCLSRGLHTIRSINRNASLQCCNLSVYRFCWFHPCSSSHMSKRLKLGGWIPLVLVGTCQL